VTQLLEQTEFAYMPNTALDNTDIATSTHTYGHTTTPAVSHLTPILEREPLAPADEEDNPLEKYLFGTPSRPDFDVANTTAVSSNDDVIVGTMTPRGARTPKFVWWVCY
jgi:hypothetical protein